MLHLGSQNSLRALSGGSAIGLGNLGTGWGRGQPRKLQKGKLPKDADKSVGGSSCCRVDLLTQAALGLQWMLCGFVEVQRSSIRRLLQRSSASPCSRFLQWGRNDR